MKNYSRTKEVKAQPMSANEAIEKGYKTSEYIGGHQGYEVEYADNYRSWLPKEMFEELYNPSNTPFERLIVEFNELALKSNKLSLFLERGDCEKIVGNPQQNLMKNSLHTCTIIY